MQSHDHSHAPTQGQIAELVKERHLGWREFTRATFISCIGIGALLFMMWLVFIVILKPTA
jgi:hypothetical protein